MNSCLSAARDSGSRRRQAGSILKKLNLAKVRSAIGATIALLALGLIWSSAAVAAPGQRVVLAWLPSDTTVADLAAAGFSPGVMSAGLGTVPAEQTYLDIGQGNRVFDSLYDRPLPVKQGSDAKWWRGVVERAESAPADIAPGLLASTLREAGFESQLEARRSSASRLSLPPRGLAIAIARADGRVGRSIADRNRGPRLRREPHLR